MNNSHIIKGFKNNDSAIILTCYEKTYPMVFKMVSNNAGTAQDAQSIIWECFEVFFRYCNKPNFTLNSKFSSFIYSIAYRLWMNKLREQKKRFNIQDIHSPNPLTANKTTEPLADDLEATIYANDLQKVVLNLFKQLSDKCQSIINLKHQQNYSHNQIAALKNISVSVSKQRLYRCSIELAKAIKRSNYYSELIEAYPFLQKYVHKNRKS